jgi:tetratricopeptide (TPR) repeat protein
LFVVLLVVTAAAYYPAWNGGVLWDDEAHLTAPALRSLHGLWRIWFEVGATQQYYPLSHSAFWSFYQLWGLDTFGYHAANILLHSASAYLFAAVLNRLQVPGAFLAATIFALHPVQVESVAWMTELKNTLSTTFYLGAGLSYLGFQETGRRRSYVAALMLFAAAVLTKTVTASLPGALLVVTWWRRGRVERADLLPLLPFFAAGAAGGLMTAWFERTVLSAGGVEYALSGSQRVLLAGRAVWFYLRTLLWPSNLTFIYPRWQIDPASLRDWLYPVALVIALTCAWYYRRRDRTPLAVLLLYCGTLFPALGFVNVYPFRYSFVADHFQYLATLPMIAAIAAAMILASQRALRTPMQPELVLTPLLGLVLGCLTFQQSRDYRDAETLMRATLARNPACWLCYNNLATPRLYGSDQELAEAVTLLGHALRLNPNSAEAHNNMGGALQRQGRFEDALQEHEQALRLNPRLVDARYNTGVVYQHLGRTRDAEAAYREVIRNSPDFGAAYANLGAVLLAAGRTQEATGQFEQAVRLRPDDWQTHEGLARALAQSGRMAEAIAEFRETIRLAPTPAAYYRLALALATAGRVDEAIPEFKKALDLNPDAPEIRHDLGAALANAGRYPEAIREFEEALRLRPDYQDARANIARVRAALDRQRPR